MYNKSIIRVIPRKLYCLQILVKNSNPNMTLEDFSQSISHTICSWYFLSQCHILFDHLAKFKIGTNLGYYTMFAQNNRDTCLNHWKCSYQPSSIFISTKHVTWEKNEMLSYNRIFF